jgi:histidinol dehydrogenase
MDITPWNGEIPQRPATARSEELTAAVRAILSEVRRRGDKAVLEFTKRFDKVDLDSLKLSAERIAAARAQVGEAMVADLQEAIRRLELFHQAQMPKPIDLETSPGVRCERRHLPIERVGLYIPGGTAPLPSTVLMLGVPARIAGCRLRVLMSPPPIDPHILVAADLLGITEIFEAGGAQAIGALAYGTQSVPKVDKIFGPGNSWVTEAKLQVSQEAGGAALDLPAGPSEVMVIADASADAAFVAADLLSQAEHGADSQVLLVSDSRELLIQVSAQVDRQLQTLPRRAIAEQALEKSALLLVQNRGQMLDLCNAYAPEHLILQIAEAREFALAVRHAGSVFLGPWTPESAGDYASGTNHVLPTYGFARAYGGLTTESFLKTITFQEITRRGLDDLGPVVERLALAEGLHGHANAVRIRLEAAP